MKVLLIHSYPPVPCLYGLEKGLRVLGHDVTSYGNTVGYGDADQFRRFEPACRYVHSIEDDGTPIPVDVDLDALLDHYGGTPDCIVWLDPAGDPVLPQGMWDAPCPTVGWFTEEFKAFDAYLGVLPMFDVAPTCFGNIARDYEGMGIDTRPCLNITLMAWLSGAALRQIPKKHDVGFVGAYGVPGVTERRDAALRELRTVCLQMGATVSLKTNLWLADCLAHYASSRIGLQTSGQGTPNLTYRVGEMMTSGAMVLAEMPLHPVEGLLETPQDAVHLHYWTSMAEVADALDYFLRSTNGQRALAQTVAAADDLMARNPWQAQAEWVWNQTIVRFDGWQERRAERRRQWAPTGEAEGMALQRYYAAYGDHDAARRIVDKYGINDPRNHYGGYVVERPPFIEEWMQSLDTARTA